MKKELFEEIRQPFAKKSQSNMNVTYAIVKQPI